ncbi:MAG: glycosyltransferase [Candidatus Woesearchaeota archaeon]
MRIAIFTDTFHPEVNGVVFSILNFSKILAERGHVIKIFAPRHKHDIPLKLPKNISIERHYSVPLATYKDVSIVFPNIFRIVRRIKRFAPDMIHIHSPSTMGLAGLFASKTLKIPTVGTFHTLLTEQTTYVSLARITRFDKVKEKAIDKLMSSFLNKVMKNANKSKIKRKIERHLIRKVRLKKIKKKGDSRVIWFLLAKFYNCCDVVTTPTKIIRKVLIANHIKAKKIRVLSNGINMGRWRRKKCYKRSNIVIHVGRIGFEKNIDVLIHAIKIVTEKNPKIKLYIVGMGPAEASIKSLVNRLGIEKNVKFIGKVAHEKLSRYYTKADVFATASTMETQGLVILEAMACGLPIVGVNKYAIPEIVKHERNGFIVRPFDPSSMAECIKLLIEDYSLRKRMGKQNIDDIKAHNLGVVVTLLEKIYKDCIQHYRNKER